jgi:hypothetical protein
VWISSIRSTNSSSVVFLIAKLYARCSSFDDQGAFSDGLAPLFACSPATPPEVTLCSPALTTGAGIQQSRAQCLVPVASQLSGLRLKSVCRPWLSGGPRDVFEPFHQSVELMRRGRSRELALLPPGRKGGLQQQVSAEDSNEKGPTDEI